MPKVSLGGFTDYMLGFFHVVLFKSIPPIVLKNLISGGLYEVFCKIVEKLHVVPVTLAKLFSCCSFCHHQEGDQLQQFLF